MQFLSDNDINNVEKLQEIGGGYDFVQASKILDLDAKTDFADADLRGVNFDSCDLSGFNFSGANLSGSTGLPSNTNGLTLDGANISDSPFYNMIPSVHKDWYDLNIAEKRDVLRLHLAVGDISDLCSLLQRLILNQKSSPRLICSLLDLFDGTELIPDRLPNILDDLVTHIFPSVRISAIKAAERIFGINETAQRWGFIMLGDSWISTRKTVWLSERNLETSYNFKGDDILISWLDPAQIVNEKLAEDFNLKISATNDKLLTRQLDLPNIPSNEEVRHRQAFMSLETRRYLQSLFDKRGLIYLFSGSSSNALLCYSYTPRKRAVMREWYKMPFVLPLSFNLALVRSRSVGFPDRLHMISDQGPIKESFGTKYFQDFLSHIASKVRLTMR